MSKRKRATPRGIELLAHHLAVSWYAYENRWGLEHANRTFKGKIPEVWRELAKKLIDIDEKAQATRFNIIKEAIGDIDNA